MVCVFFIKQKTADDRSISDGSSDVCSSDRDLLAGNLSDFQRPAQFADRPPPADYLTKGVDHQTKYRAGPLHSNARSFQKGNVPKFGRRALTADQADPVLIPKTVRFLSGDRRSVGLGKSVSVRIGLGGRGNIKK